MPKYSKKIVKRICDLISKDTYTIAEICATVRISERTYYQWQADYADFSEQIKDARHKFDQAVLKDAKNSLIKLVKGYDYEETKTVVIDDGKGKPKIKEKSTTKKHVAPNLGAIIHFQTNVDPATWKNRQNTELTGKDGKDLFASLTDEQLEARIAELEKKVKQ